MVQKVIMQILSKIKGQEMLFALSWPHYNLFCLSPIIASVMAVLFVTLAIEIPSVVMVSRPAVVVTIYRWWHWSHNHSRRRWRVTISITAAMVSIIITRTIRRSICTR